MNEEPLNKDIPIEIVFKYLLKDYRKYRGVNEQLEAKNNELTRCITKLTNVATGNERQIVNLKLEIEKLKKDKDNLIIKFALV